MTLQGVLGSVDLEIGRQDVLVAVVELLLGLDPVVGGVLLDDRVTTALRPAEQDCEAPSAHTDDGDEKDDDEHPTQTKAACAVQHAPVLLPVVIHDVLSPSGHAHPKSVTQHER